MPADTLSTLPPLIRAMAERLVEAGVSRDDAVACGVGTVQRWRKGGKTDGGKKLRSKSYDLVRRSVLDWDGLNGEHAELREAVEEKLAADLRPSESQIAKVVESAQTRVATGTGLLTALKGFKDSRRDDPMRGRTLALAAQLVEATDDVAEMRRRLDAQVLIDGVLVEALTPKLEEATPVEVAQADVSGASLSARGHAGVAAGRKGGKPPKPGEPGSPDFERLHPRGRGGVWISKGEGTKGEPSPRVKQLQERLGQLGFRLTQDGAFAGHTELAVKAFQKKYGLAETGKVDATTVEALRNPPPLTAAQVAPETKPKATKGSGSRAGGSSSGAGTGRSARGSGGRSAANANLPAGTPTGAPSGASLASVKSAAPMRRGDGMMGAAPNAQVTALQNDLTTLGFEVGQGGSDGKYGEGTETAVRALQEKYGLRVDGVVGPQTVSLIQRLLKRDKAAAKQSPLSADQLAEASAEEDDMGIEEASYSGNAIDAGGNVAGTAQPYGGIGGLFPASSTSPVKWEGSEDLFGLNWPSMPPNLHESPERSFARCGTCVHFNGAKICGLYSAGVDDDDLCDSWLTLTPAEAQHAGYAVAGLDREVQEAAAVGDSVRVGVLRAARSKAYDALAALIEESAAGKERMRIEARALVGKGETVANARAAARLIVARRYVDEIGDGAHGFAMQESEIVPVVEAIDEALLDALGLDEAADSMAKASKHEEVGHTGQGLWKHKGLQLPAYIQHIANDIKEKRGLDTSRAIAIAIAAVKRWARGGGKVDAGTRAAAAKAVAEWEKLKATHNKGKLREARALELDDVLIDLVEMEPTLVIAGVQESAAPEFIERLAAHLHFREGAHAHDALALALKHTKKLTALGVEEAAAALVEWGDGEEYEDSMFLVEGSAEHGYPSAEESEKLLDEMRVFEAAHPLTIHFNPQLHPRDRRGEFRSVLNSLMHASHGSEATLPGGVTVTRGRGGKHLTVKAGGKSVSRTSDPARAAKVALRHAGIDDTPETHYGIQSARFKVAFDPGDKTPGGWTEGAKHPSMTTWSRTMPNGRQEMLLNKQDGSWMRMQMTKHGRMDNATGLRPEQAHGLLRGATDYIHLQGIGQSPAKRAGDFQVGEHRLYNHGHTSQVTGVEHKGGMVHITTTGQDGKTYTAKHKKDTLLGHAVSVPMAAPKSFEEQRAERERESEARGASFAARRAASGGPQPGSRAHLVQAKNALVAKRVKGGGNEEESKKLLHDLLTTTHPQNWAAGLAHLGFATPGGAEKAAESLRGTKGDPGTATLPDASELKHMSDSQITDLVERHLQDQSVDGEFRMKLAKEANKRATRRRQGEGGDNVEAQGTAKPTLTQGGFLSGHHGGFSSRGHEHPVGRPSMALSSIPTDWMVKHGYAMTTDVPERTQTYGNANSGRGQVTPGYTRVDYKTGLDVERVWMHYLTGKVPKNPPEGSNKAAQFRYTGKGGTKATRAALARRLTEAKVSVLGGLLASTGEHEALAEQLSLMESDSISMARLPVAEFIVEARSSEADLVHAVAEVLKERLRKAVPDDLAERLQEAKVAGDGDRVALYEKLGAALD